MKFLTILKTIGMAAAGGAASAVLSSVAEGNISPQSMKNAAIGGAAVTALAYLKQSPVVKKAEKAVEKSKANPSK